MQSRAHYVRKKISIPNLIVQLKTKKQNKNKNLQSLITGAQIDLNPTIYAKPLSFVCSWKEDSFRIEMEVAFMINALYR